MGSERRVTPSYGLAKRGGIRALIAVWLLASTAAAANRTFTSQYPDVVAILPHLQFGFVMFNRIPTRVRVATYSTPDSLRRPIAELQTTASFGYARSRAYLNLNTKPEWLNWLCRVHSAREFIITVDELAIDAEHGLLSSAEYRCAMGSLYRLDL